MLNEDPGNISRVVNSPMMCPLQLELLKVQCILHSSWSFQFPELCILVLETYVSGEPTHIQAMNPAITLKLILIVESPGAQYIAFGTFADPVSECTNYVIKTRRMINVILFDRS